MGIREIAKEANVSIATVSRVLNNPEMVNKITRDKVLKIIKEHEYKKFYDFIIDNNFEEIAIIIPNVTNTFFSRILQGIYEEANKFNFVVNLFLTNDDIELEKKAIDTCVKKEIKGIILTRIRSKEKYSLENINTLEKNNIPFVLVDRDIDEKSYSGIFLSNANAVYDSLSVLINKGYKDIVVLAGNIQSSNSKQRIEGYEQALLAHNLEVEEKNIFYGDFSIDSGYETTIKILKRKKLPQVIFSFNNELTIGALKALKENSINLSKDVKLFSFNKIDTSHINLLFDNISYVEHDIKQMGEKSVRILKNKLVGTKGSIREILDYKIQY